MSIIDRLPEWIKFLICKQETLIDTVDRLNKENPPPPCGDNWHWWWEKEIGCQCERCEQIEEDRLNKQIQDRRDERLAQLIADKVCERLKS